MSAERRRIVVPVRGGETMKSRLAASLAPAERIELAEAMARHVIATAVQVPDAVVTVVTACHRIARIAGDLGSAVLFDRRNAGTAAACDQAIAEHGRAGDLLFVNADLPWIDRAAIERLLAFGTMPVVVVPDRQHVGTNALLLRGGADLDPCFGAASFDRHLAAAAGAGLNVAIFDDPAFAFDVDTAADLAQLGTWHGRAWHKRVEPLC